MFVTFKQWKALVEKQTGKKIKRLRTSNGLEFFDGDFNKFCKDEGIVRHLTVRGTPQQNGVAERMNRTLLEKVRCMLSNSGLSNDFWAEAASTACYLVNRSPNASVDDGAGSRNCETIRFVRDASGRCPGSLRAEDDQIRYAGKWTYRLSFWAL